MFHTLLLSINEVSRTRGEGFTALQQENDQSDLNQKERPKVRGQKEHHPRKKNCNTYNVFSGVGIASFGLEVLLNRARSKPFLFIIFSSFKRN